jgi:hypothetical protein
MDCIKNWGGAVSSGRCGFVGSYTPLGRNMKSKPTLLFFLKKKKKTFYVAFGGYCSCLIFFNDRFKLLFMINLGCLRFRYNMIFLIIGPRS